MSCVLPQKDFDSAMRGATEHSQEEREKYDVAQHAKLVDHINGLAPAHEETIYPLAEYPAQCPRLGILGPPVGTRIVTMYTYASAYQLGVLWHDGSTGQVAWQGPDGIFTRWHGKLFNRTPCCMNIDFDSRPITKGPIHLQRTVMAWTHVAGVWKGYEGVCTFVTMVPSAQYAWNEDEVCFVKKGYGTFYF